MGWRAMRYDPVKVMRTPKSVELSITNKCNLRCTYCSNFTSAGDVDYDLPKEEWLQFFKKLNQCSVMDVTLGGGEPFCREDLKDIIKGIIRSRMRFCILSNGTLITKDMAAFLASTKRCNYVQISIDGSNPKTHDICRGKGNFFKAVEGIRTLKKYRLPVSVRVTIHKYNIGDLTEITSFLLEDLGLSGFSTNSASYMGLCRYNVDKVQLSVEERSLAMETLLHLKKKYNGRINAAAGPLAEAEKWAEMEKARLEGSPAMKGRGYLAACGGVMRKLGVRSDGVMVPCTQMSHLELGRINKDNLIEVWQNHPELIRLRKRQSIPLNDFEFCRDCAYIPYCTGNCPALAYTILGEDNHPSPDSCLKRFLEEGGRLPANNPSFCGIN